MAGGRGVICREPSPDLIAQNEQLERAIATHLLVSSRRILLGDWKEALPCIDTAILCDTLFLFGPTLPRYTGRIRYAGWTRDKAIAILAPNVLPGENPGVAFGKWDLDPATSYVVESPLRRYARSPGAPKRPSVAVGSVPVFDLLMTAGDDSIRFWGKQAKQIQDLLDREGCHVLDSMIWEKADLPRGLAKAALIANWRAFCADPDVEEVSLTEHQRNDLLAKGMETNWLRVSQYAIPYYSWRDVSESPADSRSPAVLARRETTERALGQMLQTIRDIDRKRRSDRPQLL